MDIKQTLIDAIKHQQITHAGMWHDGHQAVIESIINKHLPDEAETPAAKWRESGEPDPFEGQNYDGERAQLCRGYLTDDELANEVYLSPNIGNLTAAKERIRWLSRALISSVEGDDENE